MKTLNVLNIYFENEIEKIKIEFEKIKIKSIESIRYEIKKGKTFKILDEIFKKETPDMIVLSSNFFVLQDRDFKNKENKWIKIDLRGKRNKILLTKKDFLILLENIFQRTKYPKVIIPQGFQFFLFLEDKKIKEKMLFLEIKNEKVFIFMVLRKEIQNYAEIPFNMLYSYKLWEKNFKNVKKVLIVKNDTEFNEKEFVEFLNTMSIKDYEIKNKDFLYACFLKTYLNRKRIRFNILNYFPGYKEKKEKMIKERLAKGGIFAYFCLPLVLLILNFIGNKWTQRLKGKKIV